MPLLPFEFFHIFQRPAQLGAASYKDMNRDPATPKARCARCGGEYMSVVWRDDLVKVQRDLGFRHELNAPARALFGLARSAMWTRSPSLRAT